MSAFETTPIPAASPPPLGALRLSLLAGAAWDGAGGVWAILDLHGMAKVLRVGEVREPHYLRFCGLLLLAVARFYLVTAAELRRSLRGVGAAIVIRAVGGLYVAGHASVDANVPRIFIAFGIADLAFAAIHYGLLRRKTGRGVWGALLKG